jgi:hypothetical protein
LFLPVVISHIQFANRPDLEIIIFDIFVSWPATEDVPICQSCGGLDALRLQAPARRTAFPLPRACRKEIQHHFWNAVWFEDVARWTSCRGREQASQPILRAANCFVSRASEISCPRRDKSTRRANHPKARQARFRKIFCFSEITNQSTYGGVSSDERGGSRSSRTCGGMRWTRRRRMTRAARGGRQRRVVL